VNDFAFLDQRVGELVSVATDPAGDGRVFPSDDVNHFSLLNKRTQKRSHSTDCGFQPPAMSTL
jgi:hypothetical protein